MSITITEIYDLYQTSLKDTDEVLKTELALDDLRFGISKENEELADRIDSITGDMARAYEKQGFIAGFKACKDIISLLA